MLLYGKGATIRCTIHAIAIMVLWGILTVTSAQPTLELLGHTAVDETAGLDVWGYVDAATGKEYALVGTEMGLRIFDVTEPSLPTEVGTSMPGTLGFDVKVWLNYAYMVDRVTGPGSPDGYIIDITDVTNPQVAGRFPAAHNIFIDDLGYLYLEGSDIMLEIQDLNTDPANPAFVWSGGSTGGHDATVIGDILYDFHGTGRTNIYDVSDRSNPVILGQIDSPIIIYNHNGWPTEDGTHLLITDERAEGTTVDISVYDITDLSNPTLVDDYSDSTATVHNVQVRGNYAYASYYTAGIKVFDLTDPTNMTEVGHYDTFPGEGEDLKGAFGVYVFAPSGNIYVNCETGLYIFSFDNITGIETEEPVPADFELAQNFPNPFNPSTRIEFSLSAESDITLEIFDISGQKVTTLADGVWQAGSHTLRWDAAGYHSGIYFYRLTSNSHVQTRQMVLLK